MKGRGGGRGRSGCEVSVVGQTSSMSYIHVHKAPLQTSWGSRSPAGLEPIWFGPQFDRGEKPREWSGLGPSDRGINSRTWAGNQPSLSQTETHIFSFWTMPNTLFSPGLSPVSSLAWHSLLTLFWDIFTLPFVLYNAASSKKPSLNPCTVSPLVLHGPHASLCPPTDRPTLGRPVAFREQGPHSIPSDGPAASWYRLIGAGGHIFRILRTSY